MEWPWDMKASLYAIHQHSSSFAFVNFSHVRKSTNLAADCIAILYLRGIHPSNWLSSVPQVLDHILYKDFQD